MNDDRDTHFSGFAKLLIEQMLSEVDVEIVTSFGWREDWETIIARRAYDLAEHTIDAMQPYIYGEKIAGRDSVTDVSDLIEWPSEEE